jgi:DNA-binding LacI/PurR family transcriptional regulator
MLVPSQLDDHAIARHINPPLTTVAQPIKQFG